MMNPPNVFSARQQNVISESMWSRIQLDKQFVIVGTIIVFLGMAAIGAWVNKIIEDAVTQNSAAAAALYADSIVAPYLQELSKGSIISATNKATLDQLLVDSEIGHQIVSVKIWIHDGTIVYSNRESIVGAVYPVSGNLSAAFDGNISGDFDDLEDEENLLERQENIPLLEVYSPIRDQSSGRIIAVSEFYSNAEGLEKQLMTSKLGTWTVVGLVALSMIFLMAVVVHKGSRTIADQKQALERRVEQLSELQTRLQQSSRLATELNERFLRRVGADLHDGPSQLIALTLLQLDSLGRNSQESSQQKESEIRSTLEEALKDIRDISIGLILPEFENQNLETGVKQLVAKHIQRTAMAVTTQFDSVPESIEKSVKICIYRFVQETLNNAFRHSNCDRASITLNYEDGILDIVVSDHGSGFDSNSLISSTSGMGLLGLRERIESIGGAFSITSSPGLGTHVNATFFLEG